MATSLCRADWRFLLPLPAGGKFQHMVLLGGPPDLPERLVEIGAAARVSTTVPIQDRVDALVLLADSRTTLAATVECLAPDGIVYWEVERRRSTRLRGVIWIERQLRRSGLQSLGLYWVSPDFADARRFLPLDHEAAVEWFFASRFIASTPGRLGLELVVRAARLVGDQALATLVPFCSVIATRRGREPAPALALAELPQLPILQRPGTRAVLFTTGQDEGSRVVLLPFAPGASAPAVVVKAARLPRFAGHTEQEQATLTELRSGVDSALRRSLPEPLGAFGSGAHRVFLETVMPGRVVSASTGRWRASVAHQVSDLHMAAEWLARFHLATLRRRVRWDENEVNRWLERRFDEYARAFGPEPEEKILFAAARDRAQSLMGEQIPIVWSHNDFGPWHLYRSGAEVGVIDWEFGGDELSERWGLPLCDLAYFGSHWIYLARRVENDGRRLQAFRDLFLGSSGADPRCDAVRLCLADYLRQLQIHYDFLPLLLVYTWVDRAVDRFERQASLNALGTSARSNNRFASYVGILAQGAESLFQRGAAGACSCFLPQIPMSTGK